MENTISTEVFTAILLTIILISSMILAIGFGGTGSLIEVICKKKSKSEKNLIGYLANTLLIILSMVVCVSAGIHFDVMVCFAILVPMMTRSMEDALCAVTLIGKVIKYTLMLMFMTAVALLIISFKYEVILESDVVRAMILLAIYAVPFKAFVDIFNWDISYELETEESLEEKKIQETEKEAQETIEESTETLE